MSGHLYDLKFASGRVATERRLTDEEIQRIKAGEQLFPGETIVAWRTHEPCLVIGVPRDLRQRMIE